MDCGAGAWGGESHEVGRKGDEARERRQGWKASKAGAEEEGVRFRRRDGIGKGIVAEGGRFVPSVYPRVSSRLVWGVALIAKELGIAMACATGPRRITSLFTHCYVNKMLITVLCGPSPQGFYPVLERETARRRYGLHVNTSREKKNGKRSPSFTKEI